MTENADVWEFFHSSQLGSNIQEVVDTISCEKCIVKTGQVRGVDIAEELDVSRPTVCIYLGAQLRIR